MAKKSKRFLTYVFFVLLTLLLFSGCRNACEHTYQSEILSQPSCTQTGEEKLTCAACQHSYTKQIPTLEHTYVPGDVEQAATCSQEGSQKYSCAQCGATKSEPIEKLPHTLGEPTVIAEPTCKKEGIRSVSCTVCQQVQSTEDIPVTDTHSFETELLKSPTCSHTGAQALICSVCQHTVTETLPICGHDWSSATCLQKGICPMCGKEGEERGDHDYEILSETGVNNSNPNFQSFAGKRVLRCKLCNRKKTLYLAYKHTFDLDAIEAELVAYAQSKGFTIAEDPSQKPYTEKDRSINISDMNLRDLGEIVILNNGKKAIDNIYNNFKEKNPDHDLLPLYIDVLYDSSGSAGYGWFNVRLVFGK